MEQKESGQSEIGSLSMRKIPFIQEGRITIRALTHDDAQPLQEFMEQEKEFKYLPTFLFEMQYDDADEVIDLLYAECIKESIILGAFVDGDFCGLAEFYGFRDELHKVSIGYRSLRKYWNQGVATEVVGFMMKYLDEETDIEIITASVMSDNTGSNKVAEKNGFTLVVHNAEEDWGFDEPAIVDKWIR